MFEAAPPLPDVPENARCPGHACGHAEKTSDLDLQRAKGLCRLVLNGSEAGNRIVDLYQRAPLRVMFPRVPHTSLSDIVLVNTGGGITGGDLLECSVTALPGASIGVTSQAAEKAYRALKEPAKVMAKLKVSETAKLAWLPQETIVFNQARLVRTTEIDISAGAEVLALEWLVLGRAARGERIIAGSITDGWLVRKDGRLIWADRFRVTDEAFSDLRRLALLSDCTAIGTMLYFGPEPEARLELLRHIAPTSECRCAPTLIAGLIVIRFAARTSFDLRLGVRRLLQQFSQELGQGPFGVPRTWLC
jgi:urease accessory protein